MSTGQIVGGAIGAFVGFYAGDSYDGAVIGAQLGASIGGALDPVRQRTQGPRQADLAVQISSYGASIPIFYGGADRWAGNVIWSTDLIETATDADVGKGGPSVTNTSYSYSASFVVLLCDTEGRPIVGVRRIWADNTLLVSNGDAADAAQIIASAQFARAINVYVGDEAQMPSPLIESYVGVGNCPGYRGSALIEFDNLSLGPYGNRIPQITAEVIGAGGAVVTHRNICALTVEDPGVPGYRGRSWITDRVIYLWRLTAPYVYDKIDLYRSVDGGEKVYLGRQSLPTVGPYGEPNAVNTADTFVLETVEYSGPYQTIQSLRLMIVGAAFDKGSDGIVPRLLPHPRPALATYDYMGDVYRMVAYDQVSDCTAFGIRSPSTRYFAERVTLWLGEIGNAGQGGIAEYVFRTPGVQTPTVLCALAAAGDRVYAMIYDGANMNMHVLDQDDATLIEIWPGPVAPPDYGTDIMESIRTDGSSVWAWASGTVWRWTADGSYVVLATGIDFQDDQGHIRNALGGQQCYVGNDHLIMQGESPAGNSGPGDTPIFRHQLVHWGTLSADDIAVADIIDAEMAIRGIACDTSQIKDMSHGVLFGKQLTSRAILEFLAGVYRFDAFEDGPTVRFVKRGGDVVRELTNDDLGAHESGTDTPDAVVIERAQEIDLPQRVTLNFSDLDNAYQQGSVTVQRQNTVSEQNSTVDVTSAALTADEAAKLADTAMMEAWVGRTTYKFATTYAHEDLSPTDVVALPGVPRARITKRTDQGGMLSFEAVADDRFVVESAATSRGAPATVTSNLASASDIILMDIPILRDQDDDDGPYAKAVPINPGPWPGAVMYRSDSGAQTAIGTVTSKGAAGFALNALDDYAGVHSFDESGYVDVAVLGDAALSSVTREQALGAANAFLVGDEIIAARSAVLLSAGKYRLSGLLRYQRGTNGVTHQTGERVVLLERAGTLRLSEDIGRSHGYEAVTLGKQFLPALAKSFTNTARGKRPFSPVQLGAGVDASGNATLQWRRRTRLAAGLRDGVDAPLGEASESYVVQIAAAPSFATVVRTLAANSPTVIYASGQRYADEQAGLPSPFYFRVAQVSATYGNGAWSLPQTGKFAPASAGSIVYSRTWNDNVTTGQTLFGTSVAQSINSTFSYVLTRSSGPGQGKSRFDAVPNFTNGSIEFDVQVPSGTYGSAGVVFRTTNWDGNSDSNAYIVAVNSTNALELGRGTNKAAGSYTQLVNVGGAVTAGAVVHVLVNFNGNSIQVYLGGVKRIDATDSVFSGPGQVALTVYGTASVSSTFDNVVITYNPF